MGIRRLTSQIFYLNKDEFVERRDAASSAGRLPDDEGETTGLAD